MGFKLVALSTLLLTVSTFSVEKNALGGGCVDLLCPDTASHYGLRNLVNEDTLKTDSCTLCSQCTENGYSVCLRAKDSRASRTAGGCSCAHQLAANCHTDLTQTHHPANLTMKTFTACYADALQRPPQPLAVNENSSVVVTIEPFWLEPYWRHLKIENLTLHYKFLVKAPEHCEGEVESTQSGVHTCVASVLVDLSKEDHPQIKEDDDYDHSDNYDQYDEDLPPEVQFDRDVFSGAKELESYYTATVIRERQIKVSAPKDQQIYNGESLIESDLLKFDLKPEIYGVGGTEIVDGPPTEDIPSIVEEESVTVVQEEKDESDVSDETGGTNFFEEEEKKETEEEKKTTEDSEEKEEEGVLKVNLEDIAPTKLKSQEEAKKKAEEEEGEEEENKEAEVMKEETTTSENEEEKKEDEKKEEEEEKKDSEEEEEETTGDSTTVAEEEEEGDKESNESDEDDDDSGETTTVELVEAEPGASQNFWDRFVNSFDFPRVRAVFLGTLGFMIVFLLIVLCLFYRNKYCCCCKSKESKTSNGYRYTSANQPPTELVSREKEQLRQ